MNSTKTGLSRRDFVKLSAGSTAALGLILLKSPDFDQLFAAALQEVPVIWLQGSSDSGCSESVLNSLNPKIQDLLLGPVGQKHLSIRFHDTIMAGAGEVAMKALEDAASKPGFVLVVEGAIPTGADGVYCTVGEKNGRGIPVLEHFTNLAPDASAVIALGACATHGGIPAAEPNVTAIKGVGQVMKDNKIDVPLINIPGCPPHPDWFVGTVAAILIGGLESVELDDEKRPVMFYSETVHDLCERRGMFDAQVFAKKLSDPSCLYELGCKGPVTYADCPTRLWNGKTSWCVASNAPCAGCASMEFPDKLSPLYDKVDLQPWRIPAALGLVGAVAAGAAAAVVGSKPGSKGGEKTESKSKGG